MAASGCKRPAALEKRRSTAPLERRVAEHDGNRQPPPMGLTRSQVMSRIRGRDTEPERVVRRLLWHRGLRYRLHSKTTAGRPDLVFPGPRVAVFVDGCFWHGCPAHYVRPRSSGAFWADKLAANVHRDVTQTRRLEEEGWRVCRVWEHEVFEHPERVARRIERAVRLPRWRPPASWRIERVVETNPDADMERRFMREIRDREPPRTEVRRRSTRKWKVRRGTAHRAR